MVHEFDISGVFFAFRRFHFMLARPLIFGKTVWKNMYHETRRFGPCSTTTINSGVSATCSIVGSFFSK